MEKKRILVIDDSDIVLYAVAEALNKSDYEVKTVLYPDQVKGTLTHVTASYKPDLILCDVNMPKLSGGEYAGMCKSAPSWKHIKVYFHSSEPVETLKSLVKSSGADGYIIKTNNSDGLLGKVEEILALP